MKVKCGHCKKEFDDSKQYAYHVGEYYCSGKCYKTLFLPCLECGQENMGAKTNKEEHNEQLCDKCYNSKHGLSVVTIGNTFRYR